MLAVLLNALKLALRAIRRNVLRATLTVLGILIGVAAVVTVTSLGSGARQSVGKQIETLGSNFIVVFPQQSNASGARGAQGGGVRLTEEDGKAIRREAVSIAAVAPVLRARTQFIYGNQNVSTSALGTNRDYFTVRSWKVKKGSMWDEHDEALEEQSLFARHDRPQKSFRRRRSDRPLHPCRSLRVPRDRRFGVEGRSAHRRRSRRRRRDAHRKHARADLPHAAGFRRRAHAVGDELGHERSRGRTGRRDLAPASSHSARSRSRFRDSHAKEFWSSNKPCTARLRCCSRSSRSCRSSSEASA